MNSQQQMMSQESQHQMNSYYSSPMFQSSATVSAPLCSSDSATKNALLLQQQMAATMAAYYTAGPAAGQNAGVQTPMSNCYQYPFFAAPGGVNFYGSAINSSTSTAVGEMQQKSSLGGLFGNCFYSNNGGVERSDTQYNASTAQQQQYDSTDMSRSDGQLISDSLLSGPQQHDTYGSSNFWTHQKQQQQNFAFGLNSTNAASPAAGGTLIGGESNNFLSCGMRHSGKRFYVNVE